MIYLINQLIVEPYEDHYPLAITNKIIGYKKNKKEAESFCSKGKQIIGTGWPLQKGSVHQEFTYKKISEI